jgi:hypothetical protein
MKYSYLFLFCLNTFQFIKLSSQNPNLRSVTHKIPPYIDYWTYSEKALPLSILSTTRDSSTVIMFYNFIREKNDQLTTTEVRDAGNGLVYSFNYYYNTANQVERMDKLSDVDFDGAADDLDYAFSFSYDSLGRIERMMIKKEMRVVRDFYFTWANGNIVEVKNMDGELNYTMLLSFDTLPNALLPIQWEYLTTTGTLEFYATIFSKNNLIKATLFPSAMDSAELEIHPQYDVNGCYLSNGMEGVEYGYMGR